MIMSLTKSRLAIILSKLRVFDDPKFIDEQYTVDSEIGATILWNAFMSGDIQRQPLRSQRGLFCGKGY